MTLHSQLAILGGPPVLPEGPPGWPLDDLRVRDAVVAAFADGSWGRYHGPHTERLCRRLSEMHGSAQVTLCCSGTIAVELALRGVQVAPGDEVILAGYDFPGNFRAVEAIGAKPVLVDIRDGNWCLDPANLAAAHTQRTAAIVVSHLHGGLAPMQEIVDFAGRHDLRVVEDACQVPGATIDGRTAGTWGDAGVLSFGGSKLLTAGRGGAVLTPHADVHQRMKIFAERGNDAFAMSQLQAVVLVPQLEQLAAQNTLRAENVVRLQEYTAKIHCLLPLESPRPTQSSYYKLPWRFAPPDDISVSRQAFLAAMRAEGVALDSGFRGFTGRSRRRCHKVGDLEWSARAAVDTVLLHHPVLLADTDTIDSVAEALIKVCGQLSELS